VRRVESGIQPTSIAVDKSPSHQLNAGEIQFLGSLVGLGLGR
jgi:hypothetical protein